MLTFDKVLTVFIACFIGEDAYVNLSSYLQSVSKPFAYNVQQMFESVHWINNLSILFPLSGDDPIFPDNIALK